jgi:lipopolysaccharide/colanic/teichoic acid biosynthesis glycosyltransferase
MRQFYIFIIKETFDRIIAFLLIIFLSPIFLVISLTLVFSQGLPIFYRQLRVGRHGKPFYIIKFRTMIINAHKFGTSTQLNDTRITPTGQFIRRLSLDELPQLLNVLLGEMSLVGIRAGVIDDYNDIDIKKHMLYKPGITGLAQVNGRSTLDLTSKRFFESRYNEKISFWLDLKIIIKTFLIIFDKKQGN